MKKNRIVFPFIKGKTKKFWIMFRWVSFFMLLSILHVSGAVFSQGTISISQKNVTIRQALEEIEKNSNYKFLYNNENLDVNRVINLDINNTDIATALKAIFSDNDISYQLFENNIVALSVKNAQQRKNVSGIVTDVSGIPLPGVTVVLKGTTQGTITDMDGNYSLSSVPANATLVFSFVGMKTIEIPVEGNPQINVVLKENAIGIEEVVAIGYGTVKKSDLTGSVASVQGERLAEKQATQLSQALQGSISGLMVTRTGGMADQSATVRVRGITTIGDSNPLIIIDGIPGSLDDVNPNDVESVSVLKDAASAAIYGSRAASGVILITTKRAKKGIFLNYNVEYGVETPTRIPEYEGAVRYMEMYNEMKWNDNGNIAGNEYNTYSKDLIDNYSSLNAQNPDQYPDTDWQGLMLNDNAPRQSHILSLNAGTENVRTKASFAYDKTDALYDNRAFERMTARINNDVTISDYLTASIDLNLIRTIDKRPITDFTIFRFKLAPIYAAYWSDGRYAEGKTGANDIPRIDGAGGFNNMWENKAGGRIALDFTPIEGLTLTGVISPTYQSDKYKKFQKKVEYTDREDPNLVVGTLVPKTFLEEERNDNYSVTTQFLANYAKDFGEHSLNILGGFENYYYFNEDLAASRDFYELKAFPYLDLGPLEYRDNGGSAYENAYRSWFGRAMYNFKSRYFIQVNGRYDGSSRFHEDYRWGFFPSLSTGWVISEESFMADNSVLSYLKLRASWGTLGNERIGDYPYQPTVSFDNTLLYQGSSIVSSQTAYVGKYAIRDISWETTESYDIGIDANFLDNKFRLTADYYKKTTKDMLLALEIPDYIGFDNPDQNTGEMNTTGWEIDLAYNNNIGDLRYSVSVNLSDFKSVMGELGGTEFLGSKVKFKGSEFNEWYGYVSDGLFQTQEEVDNSAVLNSSVGPGDIKYKDLSGPDGVPDGMISSEYDRALLGGSLPRYLYGGNIRLNYKNFDFSMTFQGIGKQNAYIDAANMVQPFGGDWKEAPAILDGNYWSTYNSDEQNRNVKYPRLSSVGLVSGSTNNYVTSDYWLLNGAYFRLKNITLGYRIPSSFAEKAHIKGARLYASLSDLFSIDQYPDGWDPEGSQYFMTKSFVFGLSVNF